MSTIGRTAGVWLVVLVTGVIAAARQAESTLHAGVPGSVGWPVPHVRLVAFQQERDSRRILGGASVGLDAATARVGVWR